MTQSPAPHRSSVELAERLKIVAVACEVVENRQLTPSLHEIVLHGPDSHIAGEPGNDVMVRVADQSGGFVRRRYSVREVDASLHQLRLWISTAHEGPGSRWARGAAPGQHVDVVGPRGKILLDPVADWHLFLGDVTGFGAFYRMAQSIESPGQAVFIVQVDGTDDVLTSTFDEGVGITGIFVERSSRALNDPAGLLGGLAAFALPPGVGHAYLFGEFSVTKVVREAVMDRGLKSSQIDRKAFWRMGRNNAEHGEPDN